VPGIQDLPNDLQKDWLIAAFAAAGEISLGRMPFNGVVTAAYWTPSAVVTANVTNYATLAVRNRTAAGAGTALPATRSYAATNSAAFVTEAMTLDPTLANIQFAAGDVLTFQTVWTGTGLATPQGGLTLHFRVR